MIIEEMQANLPPSEQQVPEPKKYMGSAIPSRSFRILQAMTAPESVGEYRSMKSRNTIEFNKYFSKFKKKRKMNK